MSNQPTDGSLDTSAPVGAGDQVLLRHEADAALGRGMRLSRELSRLSPIMK
jgi:hypothetical protein